MIATLLVISSLLSPADSIGTEVINGKVFVIHKVDEKETLYAISKRYGTTVQDILAYNPTADAGLEIGQILKIPYIPRVVHKSTGNGLHKVSEKETLFSISRHYGISVDDLKRWNNLKENSLSVGQELIVKGKSKDVQVSGSVPATGVHTVEQGETLFAISRKYGVSVQELREWNQLPSDALAMGQEIRIKKDTQSATEAIVQSTKPVEIKIEPVKTDVVKTEPVVQQTVKPEPKTEVITISEAVRNSDEIIETGLAELIEGTQANRKYLALHRTASVGTILKVKNEMNGREVFVRVVGKLPDTALTDKLIIKVSKSAYDRLGAIDQRFRVAVTYYK
ncbi:MAG: LysM peptidoglycan-binding domain-containing protein [Flammeovirgaceae bacterium]|nr:LysM peptidoglycan-binding domain-containing protein [Flammeovirgaceae bacterium]